MIEEFFRATDNNGSCWDFAHEPKWRAGFWENVKGVYREYRGPNKPAPGKCEKRYSVPAVHGISDISVLEQKLLKMEGEIHNLQCLLNNAKIRAADLESENKMLKQHRESGAKDHMDQSQRLRQAEARVADLKHEVDRLAQLLMQQSKAHASVSKLVNEERSRVADLKSQNKAKQTDIDTLNRSLSEAQARVQGLESDCEAKQNALDESIHLLTEEMVKVSGLESASKQKATKIESLTTRLNKAQSLVAGLESQCQAKQTEIETLNRSLNESQTCVEQLKEHQRNQAKCIVDMSARLDRMQNHLSKMPKPVEDLYLYVMNKCVSTSEIGRLAREVGQHYNGFRIERTGIYETECGRKVYVFVRYDSKWRCFVEGYGSQLCNDDGVGESVDGAPKFKLVKRSGDL
jgi:myosin heavy subunit